MSLERMNQNCYSVYISIVLCWITAVFSTTPIPLPLICNRVCNGPLKNTSVVIQRCRNDTLVERCCLNTSSLSTKEEEVLGIDLSGCNLHEMNDSLLPLHQLLTIVLDENPLKGNLDSQFSGLSSIKYLSLPVGFNCPGGNGSWENITTANTETVCEGQINLCTADNFTCPRHSYCVANGPGQILCLCEDGYYGYKCLQTGDFQTIAYVSGLVAVTVVLSLFLWVTQRRHVKKRD